MAAPARVGKPLRFLHRILRQAKWPPLMIWASNKRHAAVVRLLLEMGADMFAWTTFHLVRAKERRKTVALLLERGDTVVTVDTSLVTTEISCLTTDEDRRTTLGRSHHVKGALQAMDTIDDQIVATALPENEPYNDANIRALKNRHRSRSNNWGTLQRCVRSDAPS